MVDDKLESDGDHSPEDSQLCNVPSTAEHAGGDAREQRPHKQDEANKRRGTKGHLRSRTARSVMTLTLFLQWFAKAP